MANDYGKFQLSLKIGAHMINACADNKEEFKQRVADAIEVAGMLKEPEKIGKLEEKPDFDQKYGSFPNGCTHSDTRQIGGTGQYGPWKGLACNSCSWVNFQRKHKDNSVSWKGWQPPKDRE